MTPTCFKAMYEIPPAPRDPSPLDVMGLYESGDIYSQQDLDSFFAEYAPYVPQGTHPKLDSVDGGEAPVSPGSTFNTGESDIDMDISFSIIYVSWELFAFPMIIWLDETDFRTAANDNALPSRR